jgi:translation initiation factor 3 subunit C
MAATNSLLDGDWRKAINYIVDLDVWNYIPNEGGDKVKAMLKTRIKEEAVRTYMIINSDHYESVNLVLICEMFDMDDSTTRKIISRMIFNKELSAAWDNPINILVMYKLDPSPLQTFSQNLAEKISLLIDSNERILNPLLGLNDYREDWGVDIGQGGATVVRRGDDGNARKSGRSSVNFQFSSRPAVGGRGAGRGFGKGGRGTGGKPVWNNADAAGSSNRTTAVRFENQSAKWQN